MPVSLRGALLLLSKETGFGENMNRVRSRMSGFGLEPRPLGLKLNTVLFWRGEVRKKVK